VTRQNVVLETQVSNSDYTKCCFKEKTGKSQ